MIDPCKAKGQVCGNGKCLLQSFGYDGSIKCDCNSGWDEASNCFAPTDLCSESKCQNEATCKMNGIGNYACLCLQNGFKGKDCDVKIELCQPNPCLNNGECVQFQMDSGEADFKCNCKDAFKGTVRL